MKAVSVLSGYHARVLHRDRARLAPRGHQRLEVSNQPVPVFPRVDVSYHTTHSCATTGHYRAIFKFV